MKMIKEYLEWLWLCWRNRPWATVDKLYLQSGQFSATLKTSVDVSGLTNQPMGVSWDGTNTPWSGGGCGNKLYLQKGQRNPLE